MNNLNQFKTFQKKKAEVITNINKSIWGYTRVSSKKQSENSSIKEQEDDIRIYATRNNYNVSEMLGGTYESASGNFTRKEFDSLLLKIKKAKPKPFAIAVKFISRFSREAGGGIEILKNLINNHAVHLIETSSGLCTENDKDRLEIYTRIIEANKENYTKLERTIPGLKKMLENGGCLGKAPMGYDLYGRKVSNPKFLSSEQRVEINEVGEKLKLAWKWKLNGERDFIIISKLKDLDVEISKQKLSQMWSKPFYCGVSTNSFLDNPVRGKWKPIVSESDFMKVQKLISEKRGGKKSKRINPHRPLTGFIKCNSCGVPMTSYDIPKKGLHYYKCQSGCRGGGSLNVKSTTNSQKTGVNNLFVEHLGKYQLDEKFKEPLKFQIKKMFSSVNKEAIQREQSITSEIQKLELKLETLKENYYTTDKLSAEDFKKIESKLIGSISTLQAKSENFISKISNLENFVEKSVEISSNISNMWTSSDLETKLRIQKLVFPSGLRINLENRQYLTDEVNSFFSLTSSISSDTKGTKTKKVSKNADLSSLVAGTGLEPVTFGL